MKSATRDTVVVAGMGAKIEEAVAPSGFLCGKSAVQIVPDEGVCPYALTLWLNLPHVSELYRGLFGMRGLSPRALNIGPRQLTIIAISHLL